MNINKLLGENHRQLKNKKLQKFLEELHSTEQPVEVVWLDAAGEQKASRETIHKFPPRTMLVKTISYGIVEDFDDEALLLASETSIEEVDWTVVPLAWIQSITPLKPEKSYNLKGGK